jgi:catechol 2,3-dioxygenase-like lactoylglutathione lyase family enzyme
MSRTSLARHVAAGLFVALATIAPMPTFLSHPARADAIVPSAGVSGLDGVAQVSLVTHDLPRAIALYRDVLGLDFLFGLAFFRSGNMSVMVGLPRNAEMVTGGGTTVYVNAPDWHAAETGLIARGLSFDRPDEVVERTANGEHVLQEFADPDGNRLEILGRRPRVS